MTKITSLHNFAIKQIIKLRQASERKSQSLIIIEGFAEIKLAAKAGLSLEALYYCEEWASKEHSPSQIMNKELSVVPKAVFKKISYREHPDGFLALAKPFYLSLPDITLGASPLLLILEAVEKPGNLGAILRSADAAGVDAVLVCDAQTDIYNPNVIRASLGTVFTTQVAVCSTAQAISWLEKNSISVYAATPHARKSYAEADYRGALGIAIGTEHEGLSQAWLQTAAQKIKISMQGRIDSLNASVSAAIILFEAIRRR